MACVLPSPGYSIPSWLSGVTNSYPLCPHHFHKVSAVSPYQPPSFFCNILVDFPGLSKACKKLGVLCVYLFHHDHCPPPLLSSLQGRWPTEPQKGLERTSLLHPGIHKLKRSLMHPHCQGVGGTGRETIHKEKKVQRIKHFFHSPRKERGMEWRDIPPLRGGGVELLLDYHRITKWGVLL